MSGLLTKETNRTTANFLETIENPTIVTDSKLLKSLMKEIVKAEPKIWGIERMLDFIIGFGKSFFKRKGSNRELECFKVGFVPKKIN